MDIVKLKILGWTHYPGLFSWTQCSYKSPYKRRRQKNEARERDETAKRSM